MNIIKRYKQFIIGVLVGGWIAFFVVRALIFQEFDGLEAAGNATYLQIRNEALDDFVLVPLFFMIPVTAITLIGLFVVEKFAPLKDRKTVVSS